MSDDPNTIEIKIEVRYHGLKATQYFSKWTPESDQVFREDLTTLKLPHPKRENTIFVSYGCIQGVWPAVQRNGVLHNHIRRIDPSSSHWPLLKQAFDQLSITSLTARYITPNPMKRAHHNVQGASQETHPSKKAKFGGEAHVHPSRWQSTYHDSNSASVQRPAPFRERSAQEFFANLTGPSSLLNPQPSPNPPFQSTLPPSPITAQPKPPPPPLPIIRPPLSPANQPPPPHVPHPLYHHPQNARFSAPTSDELARRASQPNFPSNVAPAAVSSAQTQGPPQRFPPLSEPAPAHPNPTQAASSSGRAQGPPQGLPPRPAPAPASAHVAATQAAAPHPAQAVQSVAPISMRRVIAAAKRSTGGPPTPSASSQGAGSPTPVPAAPAPPAPAPRPRAPRPGTMAAARRSTVGTPTLGVGWQRQSTRSPTPEIAQPAAPAPPAPQSMQAMQPAAPAPMRRVMAGAKRSTGVPTSSASSQGTGSPAPITAQPSAPAKRAPAAPAAPPMPTPTPSAASSSAPPDASTSGTGTRPRPPPTAAQLSALVAAAGGTAALSAAERALIISPGSANTPEMRETVEGLAARARRNRVAGLTRNVWDIRREVVAKRAQEGEVIAQLQRLDARAAQAVVEADGEGQLAKDNEALKAKVAEGDTALKEAQERILQIEQELQEEQRKRQDAEDAIQDIRRECRAPFIVPSLLDAFVELSRLTTKATAITKTKQPQNQNRSVPGGRTPGHTPEPRIKEEHVD